MYNEKECNRCSSYVDQRCIREDGCYKFDLDYAKAAIQIRFGSGF